MQVSGFSEKSKTPESAALLVNAKVSGKGDIAHGPALE